MTDKYDDIINLPHHVSKRHPRMSLYNRAAQFAPFAAIQMQRKKIMRWIYSAMLYIESLHC